jgi:putative pyoverdin transport system ATP-binding/permease protein
MHLNRFVRFLLSGSKGMLGLLILSGLLAGFTSIGLLAVINRLLHHVGGIPHALAVAFVGLALLKVTTNAMSQLLLVYLTQDTILHLGLTLCSQITRASLRTLEKKGQPQVLTTLTDDTSALAWALQCVPNLIINVAVVTGCAAYLAWLSWPLFVGAVALTVVGGLTYKVLHDRAFKVIYAARDTRAVLFRHFRSLTEGIKELMMHRGRRDSFLSEDITETALSLRHLNLEATKQYLIADGWTQVAFYGLIGAVLLVFRNVLALPAESITGYVFAMMYMISPFWGVIGTLPTLTRGQVALEKIEDLGLSLEEPDTTRQASAETLQPALHQARLEMQGVVFRYDENRVGGNGFTLGPLDFRLESGDLVFVVGGNGSGKSTFVKLLSGLYCPQAGEIRLGGRTISDANRDWYRQHFSVVFSDFYLFEKLLGLDTQDLGGKVSTYLRRLKIEKKVHLSGRRLSTTDLSQGQRRRLGLLTAYLEDRPFYIFDEWAADQDPQYKQVFYTELLPELLARGKGVAVITHDDRYFHLGDRIIKLEDGRIVESWTGQGDHEVPLRQAAQRA